jgi:NAD(P)-dependent dehydrogenase (short-subunit alcohol dehydrogenase family)
LPGRKPSREGAHVVVADLSPEQGFRAEAAGSGIGLAGAKAMAREGAHVVVADLSPERSEAAAEEIRAEGFRAEASPTDVSDDAALALFVERTIASHGRLDILLSHAGIQVEGTLEAVDPAGMDASWRLIVRAHFMAARLAMPQMRAQGAGSIIVTSSNSGVFYVHEMVAYTTSKHAVNAMVRQVAVDYGRHGVRINALCPGWVDTPFNDPYTRQLGGREGLLRHIEEKVPLGRFATPEEIAEAILFCVSDRSAFMTGHALVVDGGESL